MKTYIPIYLSILLLLLHLPGRAEEYNFRHYTNKDGLSHNTVFCSLQDSRGFMWFGTEEGLNRFDGYTFRVYKNDPQDNTSVPGNSVHYLFEDSAGRVWMSTSGGVCYFDLEKEIFVRNIPPFGEDRIEYFSYIREDKDQAIWFIRHDLLLVWSPQTGTVKQFAGADHLYAWNVTSTEAGYPLFSDGFNLYFYQQENENFVRVPIIEDEDDTHITAICEIPETGILIGTNNAGTRLFRYHNRTIEEITRQAQVRTITPYSRNIYWIGTESGIYIYNVVNRTVEHLTKSLINEYTISDNAVYSITRDVEGGMWVGSFFGGISYLPKNYTHFKYYIGGKTHPGLLGNAIREICPDQYGNLWIGTEDNGVNKYDPVSGEFTNYSYNNPSNPLLATNIHGLYTDGNLLWIGSYNRGIQVIDIPTGKTVKRYTVENTERTLPTNFILCFLRTSDNRFLIGTSNGTVELDPSTGRFNPWQNTHALIRQIYEDKQKQIWVVTANGLYRHNGDTETLSHYTADPHKKRIGSNNMNSVFEDSDGTIWLTTTEGLSRYLPEADTFERIIPIKPFSSDIFYRILEDEKGMLWISSANGLICINRNTLDFQTYSHRDGLYESQFNYSSSYKSPSGELFFGTINGMISFSPSSFQTDLFIPPVHIYSPLDMAGDKNKQAIRLPYNHPTFTLSYAAISFTAPQGIEYAYQLEGTDKEWIYVNRNREVTFANLSPGNYFFKVKSTNSSGIWQENATILPITVVPPFWATTWAYIVYILTVILLGYLFYQYKKTNLEKKHLQEQEIFESQKEKELYDAKIQFFTYITHEIRTPLTLIKAPLEKILQTGDGSPQTHDYLRIIQKNTQRLLNLSNQLLDFRRTESKGFRLNFIKTDLLIWIDTVLSRFRPSFEEAGKNFIFESPSFPVEPYIDREAFAKIISNLLTNALKYAEKEIRLQIYCTENGEQFELRLLNDGSLIPLEEKENIFAPFYRVKTHETTTGSGIGLSLVRSLVESHNGTIQYSHTADGMNQFSLVFPLKQIPSPQLEEEKEESPLIPSLVENDSNNPIILIVEDQPDMCRFIANELANHFRVLMAENGKQALELLQSETIDLILSDIMMPVMDGYEFCNEVKNNIHFSHIPVILLTAQHNLQSRLKGLNQGADAYIEKPFSLELLITQINNLLKNRDLLKTRYVEKPQVASSSLAVSKMDELFLQKINDFIHTNLSNESLSVEMIAEEMNMSTSSLYRKVKGISGLSPVEFIRITRLKKAVQWMKEGEFRINEIAFMSGFSSPAYFSTCFQKQYGKSPSEFIKEI